MKRLQYQGVGSWVKGSKSGLDRNGRVFRCIKVVVG